MRKRALVALGLAVLAVGTVAVDAEGADVAKRSRGAKVRLKAFHSCPSLVRYARRHALRTVGPGGVPQRPGPTPVPVTGVPQRGAPDTSAPTAGGENYSRTNVQEAGVDEPDIVKSDGSRIFAVAGGMLHAVDARADTPRLLGSLRIDGYGHELLLRGDRLLVISQLELGPLPLGVGRASAVPYYGRPTTLLTEVDVRDPSTMRIVHTQKIDGRYLTSRLNGRTARVVISSLPRALELPPARGGPDSERESEQRNRAAIRRAGIRTWRPRSVLERGRTGRRSRRPLVACGDVRRPSQFSGLDMLTVITIDLSKGLPAVDSDGLLTDGQIAYASTRSLYVATQRWFDPDVPAERFPARIRTAIHKFDISDPDATDYRASGEVPGTLLNQWSLSERRGFLRAASTDLPLWFGDPGGRASESFVTVLDERSGKLVQVGRVGELGRGERIYAVRFIGDAGFVVTFRQVDPLYTLDLSEPDRPKVVGELKLLGYSAYLHPVGDDLLLGVGRDATEEGRVGGTQISLFDVADLRNPVRLDRRTIGSAGSSDVEYDHHAFLYWPPTALAVMPVQVYDERDGGQAFTGSIGFRVKRASGVDEVGRVSHEPNGYAVPIRRALVIGDRLYTLSEQGLKESGLDTLAGLAWVPFPAPR